MPNTELHVTAWKKLNAGDLLCAMPSLIKIQGLSTLYRANTISSYLWVVITTWNPWRKRAYCSLYIWCNPSLNKSHSCRVCNFRTLSFRLDLNAEDQYSQLKRFIVQDLTNWANENQIMKMTDAMTAIRQRQRQTQTDNIADGR